MSSVVLSCNAHQGLDLFVSSGSVQLGCVLYSEELMVNYSTVR